MSKAVVKTGGYTTVNHDVKWVSCHTRQHKTTQKRTDKCTLEKGRVMRKGKSLSISVRRGGAAQVDTNGGAGGHDHDDYLFGQGDEYMEDGGDWEEEGVCIEDRRGRRERCE